MYTLHFDGLRREPEPRSNKCKCNVNVNVRGPDGQIRQDDTGRYRPRIAKSPVKDEELQEGEDQQLHYLSKYYKPTLPHTAHTTKGTGDNLGGLLGIKKKGG